MARKNSRKYLMLGVILVLGGLLTFAFWPRPMLVDIGEVTRSHLVVTIDEEGKTRVHDVYLVATPVAGRLLRVKVEPGDPVIGGTSVVAEMLPDNPSVLDARSLTETRAEVKAAEATLQAARAERNKAVADKELADIHLLRIRKLWKTQVVSREELDLALREARVAKAAFEAARATIAVRQAEVDSTQARLDGTAHLLHVQIGKNNGIEAQVSGGLELHDRVILYPSAGLIDGTKVARRKIK